MTAVKKDLNFENKLWKAADKLRARGGIEASEYKNIVLGLVFLKYISDSFKKRKSFLTDAVADKKIKDEEDNVYYVSQPKLRKFVIEDKSQYEGYGFFFVPPKARWTYLLKNVNSSQLGKVIDEAMEVIEKENPKRLKGVLPKDYTASNVPAEILGELIKLFSEIDFEEGDDDKDILGRVYEYFLGQFADSEGKRGGEFYTPRSIVRLLVEILEPFEGCRVFDPACGSGGMFVQSQRFLKIHKKNPTKISFYGQEINPNTWQLAQMNLAIRGIYGDLKVGDSYHDDKFVNMRFDIVISNPPFNVSEWGADNISPHDPRIKYGLPPNGNANFMWIQHFAYHLSPDGIAGFVMANGALAVGGREGEIRKKIIEDDLVDVVIACPPKLFYNVALPVSLWFVTKDKKDKRFKKRTGKTLFIDARELYEPISRKQYTFTDEHIAKIANTVRAWRGEKGADKCEDEPGFCKSATLEEIAKNGYVLTPGRYVGIAPEEDNGVPFEEKMNKLTKDLKEYFKEGEKLEKEIFKNLKKVKIQS